MTTTTKAPTIQKQVKLFRKDLAIDGKPVTIIAEVRHDDECKNGHNSFAITGEVYESYRQHGEPTVKHESGKTLWLSSCGCIHDDIAEHFPELAPLIKWHLCSTDGPMHYVANTVYLAGDLDYNKLREGETRQIRNGKTGELCWVLDSPAPGNRYFDGPEPPQDVVLKWKPFCHVGKGKARELDAARSCAIWPDATDEDLTAPGLEDRLLARYPALMDEFRAAVESLGFTY